MISPDPPAARQTNHITSLDGIRGLAVLMVMFHHLFQGEVRNNYIVDAGTHVLTAGWLGVDLFFVLSGFLITGILVRDRDQPRYFRDFYMRRSLRIFPLYYGMVMLGLIISLGAAGGVIHARTSEFVENQGWLWTYLANVRVVTAGRWVSFRAGFLTYSHFWSLAVEEHFYLVWPLVVYWVKPNRLLSVAAALAGLSCIARCVFVYYKGATFAPYVLTPLRCDGLLIGAICALIIRSETGPALLHKFRVQLLVVPAAIFSVGYIANRWNPVSVAVNSVGFTIADLGFGAVILLAVTASADDRFRRLMERRTLRFFGKYSYGLYAWHVPVFLLLPSLSVKLHRFIPSNTGSVYLAKCLGLAAAVAIAMISWHAYEKHFLKLKSRFATR